MQATFRVLMLKFAFFCSSDAFQTTQSCPNLQERVNAAGEAFNSGGGADLCEFDWLPCVRGAAEGEMRGREHGTTRRE